MTCRSTRSRFRPALGVLGLVVLLMGACGGGNSLSSAAPSAAGTVSPAPPTGGAGRSSSSRDTSFAGAPNAFNLIVGDHDAIGYRAAAAPSGTPTSAHIDLASADGKQVHVELRTMVSTNEATADYQRSVMALAGEPGVQRLPDANVAAGEVGDASAAFTANGVLASAIFRRGPAVLLAHFDGAPAPMPPPDAHDLLLIMDGKIQSGL